MEVDGGWQLLGLIKIPLILILNKNPDVTMEPSAAPRAALPPCHRFRMTSVLFCSVPVPKDTFLPLANTPAR
jgi:hypothetical protein